MIQSERVNKVRNTHVLKYPKLMIDTQNHHVVLFHKDDCGTIVVSGNGLPTGAYNTNWDMRLFKDLPTSEIIKLTNGSVPEASNDVAGEPITFMTPAAPVSKKRCPKCKTEKDITEFGISRNLKSGRTSWCLKCCRDARRHREAMRNKTPAQRINIESMANATNKNQAWTVSDECELLNYGISIQELAKQLGRTVISVRAKRSSLGITGAYTN